ncbi:putative methyltransferase DDB_G0268948 [Lepisosteus oculatus]|uniref:putative methyltransferase DDB_G0268948 n=1 Tax=Lepisosteus oculatus TaxID=7918 RepID=UPI0035F51293
MAHRLFEGKEHASAYRKYRISLSEELVNCILTFLHEKKGKPFVLAVDVGCGSGQSTASLAPHFQEVVGTDISPAQLEEARGQSHPPNVSFRNCPAEELPLEDGCADLVTAVSAAHWFDRPRFLQEAHRVLKPRGCLALLNYSTDMELHYGDCSGRLIEVCREFYDALRPYRSPVLGSNSSTLYEEMYDSLPYPEKEWLNGITVRRFMPLSSYMGWIESFSSYQALLKEDPEAAGSLSNHIQDRLLEVMGVSSPDTVVEVAVRYLCVLACKPSGGD